MLIATYVAQVLAAAFAIGAGIVMLKALQHGSFGLAAVNAASVAFNVVIFFWALSVRVQL